MPAALPSATVDGMSRTMRRLFTIGLATLAGLTAWLLLAEVAGIDLTARTGPSSTTHIGAGGVAIVAALGGRGLLPGR